jgi:hypothetical protein
MQEDASADPRGAAPERSAERKRAELALAARSRRFALIADISGRLLLRG